MFDDAWLGPFEVLVFIACDHPGLLPLVIAGDVLVDGEQQVEPAAEEEEAIGTVQTFREKVLSEMRITIYGQGILVQGFMNCVERIISILDIRDRSRDDAVEPTNCSGFGADSGIGST